MPDLFRINSLFSYYSQKFAKKKKNYELSEISANLGSWWCRLIGSHQMGSKSFGMGLVPPNGEGLVWTFMSLKGNESRKTFCY